MRHAVMIRIAGLAFLAGLAFPAHPAVWHVDKDSTCDTPDGLTWATAYCEIQPAIDAANAGGGGEVWVAEGVYDEERVEGYGALILRGGVTLYGGFDGTELSREDRNWSQHPAVVDGSTSLSGGPGIAVVSAGYEALAVTMDGFMIRGGGFDSYAAVTLYDLITVTLENCVLEANDGARALSCQACTNLDIRACTFRQNTAQGIDIQDVDNVAITDTIISGNQLSVPTMFGLPAGISVCAIDQLRIVRCLIADNKTLGWGGGLSLGLAGRCNGCPIRDALIDKCVFTGNEAGYGGAIYCSPMFLSVLEFHTVFRDCVFSGNRASNHAIMAAYVPLGCGRKSEQENDTEGDILSPFEGEGDMCEGIFRNLWGPDFVNCTFVNNQTLAPDSNSPIGYNGPVCDFSFVNRYRNCVFWNNSPGQPLFWWGEYSPVDWLYVPVASHCVSDVGLPWDAENTVADPLFVDPENGDFHLKPASPCIDTGQDASPPELGGVVDDLDGHPRPLDGDGRGAGPTGDASDYDIGAYEYDGTATACAGCHSADTDHNDAISLSELLRVVQFFNSYGYHCYEVSEDGYGVDLGAHGCRPHATDYNTQDWHISLSELLRLIQFFNSAGYRYCPGVGTEDGFCVGPA